MPGGFVQVLIALKGSSSVWHLQCIWRIDIQWHLESRTFLPRARSPLFTQVLHHYGTGFLHGSCEVIRLIASVMRARETEIAFPRRTSRGNIPPVLRMTALHQKVRWKGCFSFFIWLTGWGWAWTCPFGKLVPQHESYTVAPGFAGIDHDVNVQMSRDVNHITYSGQSDGG